MEFTVDTLSVLNVRHNIDTHYVTNFFYLILCFLLLR